MAVNHLGALWKSEYPLQEEGTTDYIRAQQWHSCRLSRIRSYEHLAKVLGIGAGDAQLMIAEAFGFGCYSSFFDWYNAHYPEVDISPVAEAGPHAYCILKMIAARWKQ